MRVENASFEIIDEIDSQAILKKIELAGRTAYKSEDKITPQSARDFVSMLIRRGHLSVLEHVSLSVRLICDRGVSHELVRHRIASYTQESTRYCNYTKGKFGDEITVIAPCFWDADCQEHQSMLRLWKGAMQASETAYRELIAAGAKPEEARSVLPNSLKTEVMVSMNLRAWRHFFELRCAAAAHPQMRELATALLAEFKSKLPVIFDEL